MNQRRAVAIGLVAILLASGAAGYVGTSWLAFDRMTRVAAGCGSNIEGHARFAGYTPATFGTEGVPDLDPKPYFMADYQSVSLRSRDGVDLAGWWVSGQRSDSPAVIVVHPGFSCRRDPVVLLPAGMLHKLGFGVLMVDLRNHGDSEVVDGRFSFGRSEASDVLGAWDWLRGRGLPAERIGLLGMSSGGSVVLVAAGEDPAISATWEDGAIAQVSTAISEASTALGYPDWAVPGELVLARLFGLDPDHALPIEAVAKIGTRPLEVVESLSDQRTAPHHAFDLMVARQRACGVCLQGGTWLVSNTQHALAAWTMPATYETLLGTFFGDALGSRPAPADPASAHGPAGNWTSVDCAQWEADPARMDCSRWGDGSSLTLHIGMGENPQITYEDAYNTYCASKGATSEKWVSAGTGTSSNASIVASLKGGCGTLGDATQQMHLYYEIGNDTIWQDEDADGWGYHFHRVM